MSQRSAWMAAAIATAEVSEPPRPSVVMRPVSLCMPWKPAITATSPRSLKRLISSAPLTSRMRAEPCALRGQDRQLPALPGARVDAHAFQHDGEQPGGHLLAGGDHGVVFARVVQRRRLAAPGDQLVGLAGHGGDHDRDLMAGVDLALDVARDVADAVDDRRPRFRRISSRGGPWRSSWSPESGDRSALGRAPARKGAYT